MVKLKEIDPTSTVGYCSDSDTDDSLPELEEANLPKAPSFLDSESTKGFGYQGFKSNGPNRNEKKARKLMCKLGLRKINGFKRVTLRKDNDFLIIIDKPDVYKNPAADTYVVFGQPEFKDLNEKEEDEEEEEEEIPVAEELEQPAEVSKEVAILDAAFKESEDVIKENLIKIIKREHDLNLVTSHAKVSRARAIKELRKNKGDMVNTFVDLTIGKRFRPKPEPKPDKD